MVLPGPVGHGLPVEVVQFGVDEGREFCRHLRPARRPIHRRHPQARGTVRTQPVHVPGGVHIGDGRAVEEDRVPGVKLAVGVIVLHQDRDLGTLVGELERVRIDPA